MASWLKSSTNQAFEVFSVNLNDDIQLMWQAGHNLVALFWAVWHWKLNNERDTSEL